MVIGTKKILLAALLAAMAVALGYIFLPVPNIELVTAVIFIAGFILGPSLGLAAGLVAELLFSLFNPYGVAAPPLLIAQVFSMGAAGWCGGVVKKILPQNKTLLRVVILGVSGFTLTLFFDMLTTLSFALFMSDLNVAKLWTTFITGMGFYVLHIISNTLIFITVVPVMLIFVEKWKEKA